MKFLGPVLSYDLLRSGRKKSLFWIRLFLASFIGIIALYLYLDKTNNYQRSFGGAGPIPIKRQAMIGTELFYTVLISQFLLMLIITPGYSASTITEEKEKKTLEYLMATDLRGWEILLGKFASRFLALVMFLLAGMPVMGLAQLFGGIDPQLLLYGYGMTLGTMFGCAAVALICSVLLRRTRSAVGAAYVVVFGYLLGSFSLLFIVDGPNGLNQVYTWQGWTIPLFDIIDKANSGNPLWTIILLENGRRGGPLAGIYSTPELFRRYLFFWLGLALICLVVSGLLLRRHALRQAFGPSQARRKEYVRSRKTAVWERWPMVWKELIGENRRPMLGRWGTLVLIALLTGLIPAYLLQDYTKNAKYRKESLFQLMSIIGMFLWGLLYLRISIRAAHCIHDERDHHTLDELLTTPLQSEDILRGKWLGAVLSPYLHWMLLGCHYLWMVFFDVQHVGLVLPMFAFGLFYAFCFAAVAMFFSTHLKKASQSMMASIVFAVSGCGAFLILLVIFLSVTGFLLPFTNSDRRDILEFFSAWCPPWVNFAFSIRDIAPTYDFGYRKTTDNLSMFLTSMLVGCLFWSLLCYMMWDLSLKRFRKLANRAPYSPERVTPPAVVADIPSVTAGGSVVPAG